MIVNAIDRERVDVAAGRVKDDEGTVLLVDPALQAEDLGERDFGHAPAADCRHSGAAEVLKRD